MKYPSFLRRVIAPVEVKRDSQLKALRAEIEAAALAGDRSQLQALLSRPAQLGLSDEDVALEREQIDGLLAAIDLRERLAHGEAPETVETYHRAVAGETCYFVGPASFPDGLMDQGGKLFVTDKRVLYIGNTTRSAAWRDVKEVRQLERDVFLTVQPLDLLRFRCNSYVDTYRVVELSRHLARSQGNGGGGARDAKTAAR